MRTLHIGDNWFSERQGGATRYFYELSRHLPAAGVGFQGLVVGAPAVDALTGGTVTSFAPLSASLGARLWGAQRATAAALRADPDVLPVSHFSLYSLPLAMWHWRRRYTRRLVVHFHGPWALERKAESKRGLRRTMETAIAKALERAVYSHGSIFITLSRAFASTLSEEYRVPRERIRVIAGGADLDRFAAVPQRAAARRILGWPTDRPVVWTLRRLVHRMGLEALIESCHEIRRQVPEVLVLIGGLGPRGYDLQRRIDEGGLSSSVRLTGFMADHRLPLAYRAADLTVVPSAAWEGFGLVAAESLAAGTPVMVTPIGGLPEVVGDLAPQLVFENTSHAAVARGVVAALRGDIVLPSADACQAFARERFSWPKVATRLREVYAEA